MLAIATALSSLPLLASPSLAHKSDAETITVRTTVLRGDVSMLRGHGGNLAVSVGTDGILVVDADYANVSDAILDAIDKLAAGRPRFVIDMHWHGDHTDVFVVEVFRTSEALIQETVFDPSLRGLLGQVVLSALLHRQPLDLCPLGEHRVLPL